MGCFYAGFDYKNRINGYFKTGETGKPTPAARLAQIRQYDSFECLGYIIIKGETKSERLFIESYVRMKMERLPELTHTQNDHFLYQIESKERKYEQAQEFAEMALSFAVEACEMIDGITWERGTKKYKRS